MLKIAIFTDSFLPGTGGTENALINLVHSWQNDGHKVLIFAPNYHTKHSEEFDVIRVKSFKLDKNDMMALPSLDFRKILLSTRQFCPDVVYCCTANGMAKVALKVAKVLNLPAIGTIHTKFNLIYKDNLKSTLLTKLLMNGLTKKLNKTDAVTTVCKDMANVLQHYGVKKDIFVIRNGANMLDKKIPTEFAPPDKAVALTSCFAADW